MTVWKVKHGSFWTKVQISKKWVYTLIGGVNFFDKKSILVMLETVIFLFDRSNNAKLIKTKNLTFEKFCIFSVPWFQIRFGPFIVHCQFGLLSSINEQCNLSFDYPPNKNSKSSLFFSFFGVVPPEYLAHHFQSPGRVIHVRFWCWGGSFFILWISFWPRCIFRENYLVSFSCLWYIKIPEFQWFLMELSVRPSSSLAISAHLLP